MEDLLKERIDRFQYYNQSRMRKAYAFDLNKANLLFKVIPFLLHVNYPDLPGYIEKCPCGIYGYDPKSIGRDLFWRIFTNSSAFNQLNQSPVPLQPFIHSLKTIGSIGTIAQTEKSDCDYWVSVRFQELGPEGIRLLEQKCRNIEEWTLKKGVEIHFFLMDIDQTRDNSFESQAEKESAGSALKLLLKDELFRTHLLVGGKMPLWWLIPPGFSEQQYQVYVGRMVSQKEIDPEAFIDLGYLSGIPRSEIFGACLWQMNKALDSPFKSVLKFAYLELLLNNTSKILPVFSDTVKCLVTFPDLLAKHGQEPLELADVDPYLLLARSLVSFYQRKSSSENANFIRECLFLKTIEGIESHKKGQGVGGNLAKVIKLMENWDLQPTDLAHFRNFQSWKYRELTEFGVKVHAYLGNTYQRLAGMFNDWAGKETLTISERDITVLGRKLFTFYEKKPKKIEYIKSPSPEAMGQKEITLLITKVEGKFFFYAFQGQHDRKEIREKIGYVIKREDDLITLLVWAIANGIITTETILYLISDFSLLDLVDIQQLTTSILQFFPKFSFSKIEGDILLQPEVITRAMIVVNLMKEPVRGSKTLHSSMISTNSYGEYFIEHMTSLVQVKNISRMLLTRYFISRWNNNLEFFIPTQPESRYIQSLIEG